MRRLMPPVRARSIRAAARGVTLIELMVGLAIAAVLALAAAPSFGDFIANSRLRESGNLLYAQALLAQSEAIKRNTVVRLSAGGSRVQVIDRTDPDAPAVLFEKFFVDGVSMDAVDIDFSAQGWPVDFAAAAIDLGSSAASCGGNIRCPGLRVDGGGGIRLCGDHTTACP